MFVFDLIVLFFTTFFWAKIFSYTATEVLILSFLIVSAGLVVLYMKGNYKIREFNINLKNTYLLFEGIIITHIIPLFYLLFFTTIPTKDILIFLIANIISIFIVLRVYRILFHIYLFKIKRVKNILILGTDERAKVIADEIQAKYALKMNVSGFVKTKSSDEEFIFDEKIPIFTKEEDLNKIIQDLHINIVVISNPTELIFNIPLGVKLYKMPDFYEMVTYKYYVDENTITELYYQYMIHKSIVYNFCKRIYDIIAALIILIVTLPITGFTALRIYLTDHESPIYTQTRVGINGKTFKCYKLRTMYSNNYVPKRGKIEAKTADINDDRVIPWCKFVRKARFDEIPQMINILKGEMSIVGPRAEWLDLVKIYMEQIPYYSCRMWVRTGWTGWAQISQGHCVMSDDISEKLQYDLYYLKHRNILWEISILVKAVFLALGGRHN